MLVVGENYDPWSFTKNSSHRRLCLRLTNLQLRFSPHSTELPLLQITDSFCMMISGVFLFCDFIGLCCVQPRTMSFSKPLWDFWQRTQAEKEIEGMDEPPANFEQVKYSKFGLKYYYAHAVGLG